MKEGRICKDKEFERLMLGLSTKPKDRIRYIKLMIQVYNSRLTQFKPSEEKDIEEVAQKIIRYVKNGIIKNYCDFLIKTAFTPNFNERKMIVSLENVLDYEWKILDEYKKKVTKSKAPLEIINKNINKFESSFKYLKDLLEEEQAFYLLVDKKINHRVLNKTGCFDDSKKNIRCDDFEKIKIALEDIRNEYEATGVGIFERLEITERDRLKRVYDKLEKQEAESIEKLRQLKIKMLTPAPKEKLQEEKTNHNGITYKRCNDCGAWHNAQYNRCAPCNDFSAKNDK